MRQVVKGKSNYGRRLDTVTCSAKCLTPSEASGKSEEEPLKPQDPRSRQLQYGRSPSLKAVVTH